MVCKLHLKKDSKVTGYTLICQLVLYNAAYPATPKYEITKSICFLVLCGQVTGAMLYFFYVLGQV